MSTPQRLPIVNSDDGVWGDILVQWLKKEHYDDGTDNAVNGGHQKVTLRAGTATAGTAPIKFTSGTLLSTAEAGALEFLTDNIYFTITTGATRKTVAIYDDSSGATGDIYYRDSSGKFTRLGIGSAGNVLTVASGLPAWSPPASSGDASTNTSASVDSEIALFSGTGGKTLKRAIGTGIPKITSGVMSTATADVDYVTPNLLGSSKYTGSIGSRATNMDSYFAALENAATNPVDIILLGDSIGSQDSISASARAWPFIVEQELNRQPFNILPNSGMHFANVGSSATPTMTTNAGSAVTTSPKGSGGFAALLTNTQTATLVAIMDAVTILYCKDPSYGSIQVKDGATVLGTITCTGTASQGNIQTYTGLTGGLVSRTITLTSTGSTVFEAVYAHNANGSSGVRIWNIAHTGWQPTDYSGDTSTYAPLLTNLNPDLVLIQLGTNGAYPGTWLADYTTLFNSIRAINSTVAICIWIPMQDNSVGAGKVADLRAFAIANNCGTIDASALFFDTDYTGTKWNGFSVHPNANGVAALAKQATSILSGDPIGILARQLADTAVSPRIEQGLTVTGPASFLGGLALIGGLFNFPAFVLSETGNAVPQAQLLTTTYASFIYGISGPGVFFSDGTNPPDAYLYRSGAGQLSIGTSKLTVGTPTATTDAANKSYVDSNILFATATKSATTYILTTTDEVILANAASNNVAITLPAASTSPGKWFYVKRTDSSVNTVTLNRAGSDTIDGATSQTLDEQYMSLTVVSDGTNWFII